MINDYNLIPGYKANSRDIDEKVLGVVTDRYKVVQNSEAFTIDDDSHSTMMLANEY